MRLTILGCAVFAALVGCEQNTFFAEPSVSAGGAGGGELVFIIQPVTTDVNTSIPAMEVAAVNAGLIDTTFTGAVTLTISTNPGSGALTGTTTVDAVQGLVVFNGVGINAVGNGYSLQASAANEASTTSTGFNIVAP
jgi:hypothetical protein